MRILKARFRSGEEFLERYIEKLSAGDNFPAGGLFYPTRAAIPVGEHCLVEVAFPELGDKMLLRGFIAWRRPGRHRQKIRAGIGIEFDQGEERKVDYLREVASGKLGDAASQRKHRRLPTTIAVNWRHKEERDLLPATLDDIGPGGACLRSDESVEPGEAIVIEVLPPGAQIPLSIEGRVAWVHPSVVDTNGIGVEFRIRDTGGIRRIKEIVRRLEAR